MGSCKLIPSHEPFAMRHAQSYQIHRRYSLPVTWEESSLQSEEPSREKEEIVTAEELLAQPLSSQQVNVDIKFIFYCFHDKD